MMQSVVHSSADIKIAQRWDFEYHDPALAQVIASLGRCYPVVRFGDIITLLTDMGAFSLYKSEFFVDDGIPFLRVQNVQEQGVDLKKDTKYISREYHEQLKKSQLKPGDLLLTTKAIIGVAAVVREDLGECNMSQNLVRIHVTNGINPHYLTAFLNSRLGRTQTVSAATGPNQKYLNFERIRELKITLPPRPIQDRIAQVMQDAYAAQRQKLAEVDDLFKTMDAWAFELLGVSLTGFVPPRFFTKSAHSIGHRWDFSYHQASHPTFTNDDWCSFEHYATTVRDTFTPSRQAAKEFYYIGIQSMDNDPFSTEENSAILRGDQINGLRKLFRGGDVLLARLGPTIGNKKSAIVPNTIIDGCCSPEFLVIRPKDGVDNRFLLWLVKADFLIGQMLPKTRGATPSRTRLYGDDLLKLSVPRAEPSQQQTIGRELERRRTEARRLRAEAKAVVAEAKARVERMILGEEA
jgi:type I restriction enzyme S subunit